MGGRGSAVTGPVAHGVRAVRVRPKPGHGAHRTTLTAGRYQTTGAPRCPYRTAHAALSPESFFVFSIAEPITVPESGAKPVSHHRPSHGERSEGEEPAGPAMRPAMGVGPGGWPQATCKDTGRAAGNVDTPSSHGGRASCAPETGHAAGNERTARPRDGRGRAEAGAEAQRVRLKTEGARATGIMVWLPTP